MSSEQEPATLQELAETRRARDRPTHVHVVGDLAHDPPKGIEQAKRVAEMLIADGGTVLEDDYHELGDGDVAFVRFETPIADSYEERREIQQLAHMSRANAIGGIVLFTEHVAQQTEQLLDARVWAESGSIDRVDSIEPNRYDGEPITRELDGLL